MGKNVINSLTKKDGNKLGKRKQKLYNKNSRMEEYMFKRVNINDLDNEYPSTMANYTYNEVSINKRLELPSFIESLTPVLSVDRGIPAGDFASIGVVVVGEDNHWKNGRHMQMLVSVMKHEHSTIDICLEEDPKEVIDRVENMVKEYDRHLNNTYIKTQIENEFYKLIEKYGVEFDKNNDKDHSTLHSPILDHDLIPISCSKNNDEVDNELFLRARSIGKSIVYPNILIPVKATK